MGVVQALVDLHQFDEILVLPVYRHMFDTKRSQLVSYDHRVEMCRLSLQELLEEEEQQRSRSGNSSSNSSGNGDGGNERMTTKVSVSTAEEVCYHHLVNTQAKTTEYGRNDDVVNDSTSTPTSATPTKPKLQPDDVVATTTTSTSSGTSSNNIRVGTADLLEMLQRQQPDTDFTFCLGGDTFLDLTAWKWKRSKDVLRLLDRRLVVIYRKGLTTTTTTKAAVEIKNDDRDGKNDAGSSNDDDGELNHRRLLIERVDAVNNDHTLGRQYDHKDKNSTDDNTRNRGGNVQLLDVPCLGDVSSSMARKMDDPERLRTILPTSVVQYIMDHKLYAFESPF